MTLDSFLFGHCCCFVLVRSLFVTLFVVCCIPYIWCWCQLKENSERHNQTWIDGSSHVTCRQPSRLLAVSHSDRSLHIRKTGQKKYYIGWLITWDIFSYSLLTEFESNGREEIDYYTFGCRKWPKVELDSGFIYLTQSEKHKYSVLHITLQ